MHVGFQQDEDLTETKYCSRIEHLINSLKTDRAKQYN